MRLYRGLTIPFEPARVGSDGTTAQGTDFTDCPFAALRYASGRRGEVLVLEVPREAGYRVTQELWLGTEAERWMVWGEFGDLLVAILPAKDLRHHVRRKGVARQSPSYKRTVLESVVERWLVERHRECEQVIAQRMAGKDTARRASAGRRKKPRFSTSTVEGRGALVPWLAAAGPLSYTPESPPDRDYYFQYSWVLPGIFASGTNLRKHFWFGAHLKEATHALFAFWESARAGKAERTVYRRGRIDAQSITAPVAVYLAHDWDGTQRYVVLQHGSYQFVPLSHQPLMPDGEVLLYRGLGQSETFRWPRERTGDLGGTERQVWERYVAMQAHALSDSVRSFNSIHDRVKRAETCHLRDDTWMTDDIASEHALDIEDGGFTEALWGQALESFSLAPWVAKHKFGPHYVVMKTPLDNIRLATFFAGEQEVRVVDPSRVEVVDARGCRVDDSAGALASE